MNAAAPASDPPPDTQPTEPDFAGFDRLVESLDRWSGSLSDWAPARRVHEEWRQVAPRLDRARRELSRVLVVGVVGGTGTGKSTLVNALAGCDVTAAGDVARPTTIAPVVVASPDVDLSWLPLEAMAARVVRSDAPAVANIVLVDCPDPDTQPVAATTRTADRAARPSDSNRNRDLLEAVLPACDVLLLVATAQKYKSWIVARELAAFAPGRPLLFVQTHAARDPDIRADWRQELEAQGFSVPRIFRLDGVEAGRRTAALLEPEPGFRELVEAIEQELVGRAARRVRRTGAIDLAAWFTRQARTMLDPVDPAVSRLTAGVGAERARLEAILATAVGAKLRAGRGAWQRLITDEVVARWHGGPFATFLHVLAALGGLWRRSGAAGGVIGRLLAAGGRPVEAGDGGWQAVAELGLGEIDVEQSRSILSGLAAGASLGEPLVGRPRIDAAAAQRTTSAVLDRTGAWLGAGIAALVADRRGRAGGPTLHWICEVAFVALLALVLVRAGWDFFVGHLWLGRPHAGEGGLQAAVIWVVLWGLLLRWIAFAVVRRGLDRDITALVGRLPAAGLVDPLLDDFATAAVRAREYLDTGARLGREAEALAAALGEPAARLGRLRGERP
jgi:energy-coupling factor transporter ATP-binding protein EcfA2